jgi:predicted dehydrogenase
MLRVGILGAGGIAERAMVEPSKLVDGLDVIAIGARDPKRAADFAERLGLAVSGDYETVINHPDIDLIYLALPPIVHADIAAKVLAAGKHVLCEKPLSSNEKGAQRIADAAEANNQRAFVGFHYRLHGFTKRLLEVLNSGILGEIQQVEIDFSIPHFVVQPGNIRLDGDLAGGSVMDVGCYAVDLLRAAWGEPKVISAKAEIYKDDPRIDLQTDAILHILEGVEVKLRTSFIGDDKGSMSLRVVGSSAILDATSVIVPQWGATLKVVSPVGETLLEEAAQDGENSYVRQLEHLASVLKNAESSILDASRAVGTMRVVDEIYRAAGLEPR